MSELTTLFKNTADAIRSKTGDTSTMQASQFPAKIQGISVGISQDEADARYLQLSGGTMTGALTLAGDPAGDLQAATKQYVDNTAQKRVLLGTYTGTGGSVSLDFSSVFGDIKALTVEAIGAPTSTNISIQIKSVIWIYALVTPNNKIVVSRPVLLKNVVNNANNLCVGPSGANAYSVQNFGAAAPIDVTVTNTYGLTLNFYAEL